MRHLRRAIAMAAMLGLVPMAAAADDLATPEEVGAGINDDTHTLEQLDALLEN